MRSIKLLLGLAVSVGLLVVVAAPAMAAPAWFECQKKAEGKFTDSKCSKSGAGEFEWVQLTSAVKSVSEGELELEDSESTLGAVRLKCKVSSTGVVGPHSEDKIETASVTGCTVVKGTCGSPKAEAVHLPWNTELVEETGGEFRDKIKNSGAGLPGYKVTCTVIIKVSDTCEAETSTGVANNLTEGLVEAKFETKSGKAKCSLSKKESGTVTGTLKTKTSSGAAISVK
jgi:hypothetical protein